MKIHKNQPVYYIPYVRMREDIMSIKAGAEYPIYGEQSVPSSIIPFKADEIEIMVSAFMGCNIIKVPLARVDMFVNRIIPKFKLGDIVTDKDNDGRMSVWRIFEYTILQGRVWYRNGWSLATNCENGMYEDKIRLATKEEIEKKGFEYYDSLVKEKKLEIFKSVVYAS